jgi:multiple sugar transport system substrate-binding protein
LAKQLTREEGGVQYRGFFASISHLARLNQLSYRTVDPATNKATLDNDNWKAFMNNIVRFYELPGYKMDANLTFVTNKRNKFIQEKSVAMWLPVSTQHTAQELADLNWDIASFPVDKQKPGVGPQPYPNAFWLTSISKQKDEAFQAIAYLASESFQLPGVKRGEFVSALKSETLRKSFGQESDLYKGKNSKAMLPAAFAPAVPITRFNSIAESNLLTAFNDIILGKKDVNTALRSAEEASNKKMQEELNK